MLCTLDCPSLLTERYLCDGIEGTCKLTADSIATMNVCQDKSTLWIYPVFELSESSYIYLALWDLPVFKYILNSKHLVHLL